jgi:hypothetical protein
MVHCAGEAPPLVGVLVGVLVGLLVGILVGLLEGWELGCDRLETADFGSVVVVSPPNAV